MSPGMKRNGKLTRMFVGELRIWPDQRRELDAIAARTGKKRNAIVREFIDQGIKGMGERRLKEVFEEG